MSKLMPKTERELIRSLEEAFDAYVRYLEAEVRKLGKTPGEDIGGLTPMAEFIGVDKAKAAYQLFLNEHKRLNSAYSDYMTAPLIAAEKARKAIEEKVARLQEAQQHVIDYKDFLECEKIRAVAVVKFANFTPQQAQKIVTEAEKKLEDARTKLEYLLLKEEQNTLKQGSKKMENPTAGISTKDKGPVEKMIDLGDANYWAIPTPKGTLFQVAPPLDVTKSWGLPPDSVTFMVNDKGVGRLRFYEGDKEDLNTSKVQSMKGAVVQFHGEEATVKWKSKYRRAIARFSADATEDILGLDE